MLEFKIYIKYSGEKRPPFRNVKFGDISWKIEIESLMRSIMGVMIPGSA